MTSWLRDLTCSDHFFAKSFAKGAISKFAPRSAWGSMIISGQNNSSGFASPPLFHLLEMLKSGIGGDPAFMAKSGVMVAPDGFSQVIGQVSRFKIDLHTLYDDRVPGSASSCYQAVLIFVYQTS